MNRLACFTDRDKQIAAFNHFWNDDSSWIIVFSGMSGNGKSTLIDYLIETRCKPQKMLAIKVDIGLCGGLNIPAILEKITDLFQPEAAREYQLEAGRARQNYDNNIADIKKAKAARDIDIQMIAEGNSQITNSSIRVAADDIGEEKLFRNYQESLLAAFRIKRPFLKQERIVLFFDTFEHAQDNTSAKDMVLFWDFLNDLHQANSQLRIIVGGREDLQNATARDWRQNLPLDVFDQDDSNAFLLRWSDGQISPEIMGLIFELAEGHPLLTEMAAQLWRDGRDMGSPLTPQELQEGLTYRSGKEWLYERIINRFEQSGNGCLAAAARYGPLLRSFTFRSLNAILPEEAGKLDDTAFEKFTRYAFIKKTQSGYEFHDLMRATQRVYLDKKDDPEVDACHRRAVAFFLERLEKTQDQEMARNALYHSCFVDPAAALDEWKKAAFSAQLSGERGWWDELLIALENPAQQNRLSLEQKGNLFHNRGLWHIRGYNLIAALESYGQALSLFRAVGDRLGEANTLKAIGDVQRFKDENDAALESYGQALSLFRAVGDRLGEANTLKAIGDVQRFKDENDAALESYGQALSLFRAVGDRLGEANTLKAIGFLKLDVEQAEDGLAALDASLTLYQQVGDRVGQVNIYWGLGIRLAQKGHLQEAEPLIDKAVVLGNEFIPDHPFIIQIKNVLEQIRKTLGK